MTETRTCPTCGKRYARRTHGSGETLKRWASRKFCSHACFRWPLADRRWTPELDARLRSMWAAGRSGSQIASALASGFTRCAVMGRVRKLNLTRKIVQQPAMTAREARLPRLKFLESRLSWENTP